MSFSPTASIVIPAYNAQSTLRACLESVCALEFPQTQFEIFVVDNNSRDNTRSVIQAFAPRVQYLYEKKRGPAAARNCGIAHAQNEIVAFTDADCVVEREWLAQLLEPLRDENVGIVGGAIRAMNLENAVEKFGEQINDQEKAICLYAPPHVASANWASPRAVLNQVGRFDANLRGGEDTDLAWRMLQLGKRIAYQANARVYHRNESTMRGLFRQGFQHGYNSIFVNRKHEKFLQTFHHHRFQRASYVRLLTSLRAYLATGSTDALCDVSFNGGKKLGKLVGSLRAGYWEL